MSKKKKKQTQPVHYDKWSIERYSLPKEKFSFRDEYRYRVIDENGNVIDDAQGYGYKSNESARKAFEYKNNPEKRKETEAFKKIISDWWKKNKGASDYLEMLYWWAFEDREELTLSDATNAMRKYIAEHNLEKPEGIHTWQLIKYNN